jgi:hypothetical protein
MPRLSFVLPLAGALLALSLAVSAQVSASQDFGAWRVQCRVDSMSDKTSCLVFSSPPQLYFAFKDGRVQMVGVGTRHDPGSLVMLRLDSEPAMSATAPGFSGTQAQSITEGMLRAQRVRTRYTKFPREPMEHEFSTQEFEPAMAFAIKSTEPSAR